MRETHGLDPVECHLAGSDQGAEWLADLALAYGRYRCVFGEPVSRDGYGASTTWCVTSAYPDRSDGFDNASFAFPAEVTNSDDPSVRSC